MKVLRLMTSIQTQVRNSGIMHKVQSVPSMQLATGCWSRAVGIKRWSVGIHAARVPKLVPTKCPTKSIVRCKLVNVMNMPTTTPHPLLCELEHRVCNGTSCHRFFIPFFFFFSFPFISFDFIQFVSLANSTNVSLIGGMNCLFGCGMW